MKAYQKETELTDEAYADILTECYGEIDVCGMKFDAGRALKALDETAFNCSKNDYESGLDEEAPVFVCGVCGEEYTNDEASAEECCKELPA